MTDAAVEIGPAVAATPVQELLARRDDIELSFIRHRTSGTVHVIVPSDPDNEDEPPTDDEFDWIGWATAARLTLCGYVARMNLGGVGLGDELTDCFADEQLCRRCARALGPHSARAFEHPLPGYQADDGTAPSPGQAPGKPVPTSDLEEN